MNPRQKQEEKVHCSSTVSPYFSFPFAQDQAAAFGHKPRLVEDLQEGKNSFRMRSKQPNKQKKKQMDKQTSASTDPKMQPTMNQ